MWILRAMTDAQHIAHEIGQRQLAERLGVGLTAVNNAITRDQGFPPAWYPVVKAACEEIGIDCPMTAFRWREPAQTGAA